MKRVDLKPGALCRPVFDKSCYSVPAPTRARRGSWTTVFIASSRRPTTTIKATELVVALTGRRRGTLSTLDDVYVLTTRATGWIAALAAGHDHMNDIEVVG